MPNAKPITILMADDDPDDRCGWCVGGYAPPRSQRAGCGFPGCRCRESPAADVIRSPAPSGPDPALPTTWIGRDDKGRADPGGTLPAGCSLPGHATYWRQPGMADWCEV